MLLDFHTHAFPDRVAQKAMPKLSKTAGITPLTDGTAAGLVEQMDRWGVDRAVVMNIATDAAQQKNVNLFASALAENPRLYAFGSVHPEAPDALDALEQFRAWGLKGVKLHPDYQNFMIDHPKMDPIYQKITELKLPVLFHAGYDPLSPHLVHAPPERSARVLERFPDMTVILAHFGGNRLYDDVERYLVGKNVYLDISLSAGDISLDQAARIILNHGAERILFGSDCPWQSAEKTMDLLGALPLSKEQLHQICWQNGMRLLGQPEG